jgi:crotonyl-CoA reductase
VSTDPLADAVRAGAPSEVLRRMPVPAAYTAAHLRVEDVDMFRGVDDKDVRKSLRVGPVEMPELAPDEVLVAVMASAVNYNTVWSATFEPLPTFRFLRQYGKQDRWAARHDQPYHVMGSDAAGVVVRVGAGVRRWKIGDHVAISPVVVDDQEPATHNDAMVSEGMISWGFENNFGGLAHYTTVRASQLLPKAGHLSWEEAAGIPLCAGTAYRMLVGRHGARMKQGDIVLVWGAVGGLGAYAVQLIKNGGGIAIGVVSSEAKAEAARRLGYDVVINRTELGIDAAHADRPELAVELGKRLGKAIRAAVGEDPHIVFEHTGKLTFGISVFVVRRGGTVITCGSSSGYTHQFDNRYLWMKLKRIIGSHAANLAEMTECNRLTRLGKVGPVLSAVYPLAQIGEATRLVQLNDHYGKIGVLCLAEQPGLGITDPEMRERVGPARLDPLRGNDAGLIGAAR